MIKINEIREMIRLLEQSNIGELRLENEHSRIYLKRECRQLVESGQVIERDIPEHTSLPREEVSVASATERVISVRPNEAEKPSVLPKDEKLHQVVSPMVGTFYRAPALDAPPYVNVGDQVEKTSVVCIVEAMKLFNEIEADVKGEIVAVLVENGQLVEHGQPLFQIRLA